MCCSVNRRFVEGEVWEVLEVPAVMCRVPFCTLFCMLEAVEGGLSFGVSKFPLWQVSRRPMSVVLLLACPPNEELPKTVVLDHRAYT